MSIDHETLLTKVCCNTNEYFPKDPTTAKLMGNIEELDTHECEDGQWWREYDAQGIYLCRVCDKCYEAKMSRYRPEILHGYTQADVDEPIDE